MYLICFRFVLLGYHLKYRVFHPSTARKKEYIKPKTYFSIYLILFGINTFSYSSFLFLTVIYIQGFDRYTKDYSLTNLIHKKGMIFVFYNNRQMITLKYIHNRLWCYYKSTQQRKNEGTFGILLLDQFFQDSIWSIVCFFLD